LPRHGARSPGARSGELGDGPPEAFGRLGQGRLVLRLDQHEELLAAEPIDPVAGPKRLTDRADRLALHVVPREVAEPVVDQFESDRGRWR
jgi:hypothetical protein